MEAYLVTSRNVLNMLFLGMISLSTTKKYRKMRIFSKYSQATLVFLFFFGIIGHLKWLGGRVVMQRIANPWTPVRFRPQPPNFLLIFLIS